MAKKCKTKTKMNKSTSQRMQGKASAYLGLNKR